MKEYYCKYCKQNIRCESVQSFGGHVTTCKFRPKRNEFYIKVSKKLTKKKLYKIECKGCNKKYELNLTPIQYEKNRYRKYCSMKCANSNKLCSKKVRKNISEGVKKAYKDGKMKRTKITKKQKREQLFDRKCFICFRENDKKHYIHTHRKDGKKHKLIHNMNLNELNSLNPKEYVKLCNRCHKGVHWLMKYFNMTWEEIEERYNKAIVI